MNARVSGARYATAVPSSCYICIRFCFAAAVDGASWGKSVTVVRHPLPGTIVRVDLSEGFREPEMGKRRPCVVLSPPIRGRPTMCTIVPLSTTAPNPVLPHHLLIAVDPVLPRPYDSPTMWLKGDIVLTIAFHRLRLLQSGWDHGQRVYDVRVLEPAVMDQVRACVRAGLGL